MTIDSPMQYGRDKTVWEKNMLCRIILPTQTDSYPSLAVPKVLLFLPVPSLENTTYICAQSHAQVSMPVHSNSLQRLTSRDKTGIMRKLVTPSSNTDHEVL